MSYFARVSVKDWKVEDAIKHYKEKNHDPDKSTLQLVLDDLTHLTKRDHNGKGQAALKFMNAMEDIMKTQSCEISGGNISVGNIIGSVGRIGNTVQILEDCNVDVNVKGVDEPFPCDLSPIDSNNCYPTEPEGLDDSFVSDTYHPNRTNLYLYDSIDPWPNCTTNWTIGDLDVVSELKTFWEVSSHLARTQGNISDIRILALHRIFPFLLSQKDSITMYIDHHDEIRNEFKALTSGCPATSSDLILWCHSLTTSAEKWATMKKKCFDIMKQAYEKGDDTDILASNILFNLAPRLARKHDTYMIEDTFIHLHLDSLLDDMFSTEEVFYQSWANSSLESSAQMKPDWLNYIRPWHMKIDITACEVKPPSKQGNGEHSDFVKLGLEMRGMINKMLDIIEVEDAMVFGILVEGYHVTTYAMDLKAQLYRMIQLGSCNLMSQQSDLGAFPVLFRCLLQVKTLAAAVANKIKVAQLERAKGKRKNSGVPTWRSNDVLPTTKKKRPSSEPTN